MPELCKGIAGRVRRKKGISPDASDLVDYIGRKLLESDLDKKLNWYYEENGKKYWEWRNAYRKLLEDIVRMRYDLEKHHDNGYDKQYVQIMKDNINRCQLWIQEMKKPVEIRIKEEN